MPSLTVDFFQSSGSRDLFTARFEPSWSVASVFGGALASAVLRAAAARSQSNREPYEFAALYVQPILPGEATVSLTTLRETRSFEFLSFEISQDGRSCVAGTLALSSTGEHEHTAAQTDPLGRALPRTVADRFTWQPHSDPDGHSFRSSLQLNGTVDHGLRSGAELIACATDMIGPAIADRVPQPFGIATLALSVSFHRDVPLDATLTQVVEADLDGRSARSRLRLLRDGHVVATSTQTAVVVRASGDDVPQSITAFATSVLQIPVFINN